MPPEDVADDLVNDISLPVATDGDPTEQALLFSIQSVRTLLSDSDSTSLTWPAFAALRGAARATKVARLRMALIALVSEARIVFGACLLLASASPAPVPRSLTRPGRRLHSWICTLLSLLAHGTTALPSVWEWSFEQCMSLHQHLLCLAAPAPPALVPVDSDTLPVSGVLWHTPPRQYPALYAFLHSLRRPSLGSRP